MLVDRIWPRGLRKEALHLDEWARDVAPSGELRTWYGHDPARFGEFRRRYIAELARPGASAALGRLRARAAAGPVTLLTATRDVSHSQAAVLAELLGGGAGPGARRMSCPAPSPAGRERDGAGRGIGSGRRRGLLGSSGLSRVRGRDQRGTPPRLRRRGGGRRGISHGPFGTKRLGGTRTGPCVGDRGTS